MEVKKTTIRQALPSAIVVAFSAALFLLVTPPGKPAAQEALPDYVELYSRGDYAGAYEAIRGRLLAIYDRRVDNRRVPTDFITAKKLEERINVNDLYRKRVAEGFFI